MVGILAFMKKKRSMMRNSVIIFQLAVAASEMVEIFVKEKVCINYALNSNNRYVYRTKNSIHLLDDIILFRFLYLIEMRSYSMRPDCGLGHDDR